jgi:ribosomal protein L11 methyltransferase
MKTHLWQVSVNTSHEAEEAVAVFYENLFGWPPSVFSDAATPTATVSAYCPKLPLPEAELRAWLRTALEKVRNCGLNIGSGRIAIRRIAPANWRESWKKHFKPFEISRALLVKPTWSRRRPRAGQAVVVLDPGLSFGTGQHPTTAFCLEQLATGRASGRQPSFLDIGTGSGILAIAAAKLGYEPVRAFDVDPAAVRVARANAIQNRVEKRVRIVRQDLMFMPLRGGAKFDVICANLTSDLLVEQAKRIVRRLRPTGTLILAGILKIQFVEVHRTYAATGLKLIATRQNKEWHSAAFAFPVRV